jgi:uncharacterized membrane protein
MARKIKKQLWGRYSFALILIVLGIFFMYQNIGTEFLGFDSLGNWLVYVGFVMIAIITLQAISNKKRIVDERMKAIAFKASRLTFVLMIFAAFTIMIIDGIKTITIPYHLFMSYAMAYMMLVYFVSYKILEKYN